MAKCLAVAGLLSLLFFTSSRRAELLLAPTIHVQPPSDEILRNFYVVQQAKRWNVDTLLALAVSHVENWSGDPNARSRSGAYGLMQVIPTIWMGVFRHECGGGDLTDRKTNACYGVLILKNYIDLCRGRLACTLRRYNGYENPSYVALVDERMVAMQQ